MGKYILLKRNLRDDKMILIAQFSTLENAHKGRLNNAIKNPYDNTLLFNVETNKFLDWRKKDIVTFENKVPFELR